MLIKYVILSIATISLLAFRLEASPRFYFSIQAFDMPQNFAGIYFDDDCISMLTTSSSKPQKARIIRSWGTIADQALHARLKMAANGFIPKKESTKEYIENWLTNFDPRQFTVFDIIEELSRSEYDDLPMDSTDRARIHPMENIPGSIFGKRVSTSLLVSNEFGPLPIQVKKFQGIEPALKLLAKSKLAFEIGSTANGVVPMRELLKRLTYTMWRKALHRGVNPWEVGVFLYGLTTYHTKLYSEKYGFPVIANPVNFPGYSVHYKSLADLILEFPPGQTSFLISKLEKFSIPVTPYLLKVIDDLIKLGGIRELIPIESAIETEFSSVGYLITGSFQDAHYKFLDSLGISHLAFKKNIMPPLSKQMHWEFNEKYTFSELQIQKPKNKIEIELYPNFKLKNEDKSVERIMQEFFVIVKNEPAVDLEKAGFYFEMNNYSDWSVLFENTLSPIGVIKLAERYDKILFYVSGKTIQEWITGNKPLFDKISTQYTQSPIINSYLEAAAFLP